MGRAGRVDLRWCKGRKMRFLGVLAETYDMDEAAAAAGLSWSQLCELRARDPVFAGRWAAVIAAGYDRLEAMMLKAAGAGRAPAGEAAPDLGLARELLKQRATGAGKRPTDIKGGAGAGAAAGGAVGARPLSRAAVIDDMARDLMVRCGQVAERAGENGQGAGRRDRGDGGGLHGGADQALAGTAVERGTGRDPRVLDLAGP